MNIRFVSVLCANCLLCIGMLAAPPRVAAEVLIPATHAGINYYGRFDVSTPATPKFNWSGCVIEASFPGPSIGFKLTDGNTDYDVEIDGKLDTIIRTKSAVTQYTVATNLSAGPHTIRIIQRSENHWNAAVFGGLYLADGNDLLAAPVKPARKIEFIGDSYTVGYGNESASRTCSEQQLRSFTNSNRSFPMLITRAFHAQCMALGWSGAGMVRNYGESAKKSATPYSAYYGKTLGALEGDWTFSKFTPDLVVICLCTNDYSTAPHPDDSMFSNGYHAFIARVLGNYPGVPILCVGTNTDSSNNVIKRIVADETGKLGHAKVFLDSFPQNLKNTGCDWHPNVSDDSAVAKRLVPAIMKIMSWDTATVTTIERKPVDGRKKTIRPFGLRISGKTVTIVGGPETPAGEEITITDCKGRIAFRGRLDGTGALAWNFPRAAGGMYVCGNGTIGWTRIVKNN